MNVEALEAMSPTTIFQFWDAWDAYFQPLRV